MSKTFCLKLVKITWALGQVWVVVFFLIFKQKLVKMVSTDAHLKVKMVAHHSLNSCTYFYLGDSVIY